MANDNRDRKRLTRRKFIRHSGEVGASVALAPLVLNLSACSTSPAANAGKPGTPSGTGAPSQGGSTPTNAANGGAAPAGGAGASNASPGGAPSGGAAGSGNPSGGSTTPAAGGSAGSGGSGGGTANMTASSAIADGAVLLGLYKGDGKAAMQEAAKKLDFSWLKSGDTVLIKVAVNSQFTHPTTTSPNGVAGMVAELKARGAGKVIVADQSGVEHVRLSAVGRYAGGTTRDMFMMSGMMAVEQAGAETHFFDDQPFDTGYFMATLPDGHRWPRGLYLPAIIKQVDHIIYMPRIGNHVLAGVTLSQKSAIGWIRDDSRHDLHNDAKDYYEKYTEINYTKEIRDRFRMTVTVSEKVLLHGGPDTGTPYDMNPVLVHASTSMPNHDALGASMLVTLNQKSPTVAAGTQVYNAANAPTSNSFFANGFSVVTGAAGTWTSGSTQTLYTAHMWEQGITKDRALARGWVLSGGMPTKIDIVLDGEALDPSIKSGLVTHGESMYNFG